MSEKSKAADMLWQGKFLQMHSRDGWEFCERTNASGVVAVLAFTDSDELILTEQYRPPLCTTAFELPAGLVGDQGADEDPLEAAARELEEETGYVARDYTEVFKGPSSAGLTSEVITFVTASGLEQRSKGGGVDGEDITIHLVPRSNILEFCQRKMAAGCHVDPKVFAALYVAEKT